MKAWLKGGIISILLLILLILTQGYIRFFQTLINLVFFLPRKLLVYAIEISGLCQGEECWGLGILTGLPMLVVWFFCIGAFIGWVYGKVKPKEQVPSNVPENPLP